MARQGRAYLTVRDVQTKNTYPVKADEHTVFVTMGGVKVKLHPNTIKVFVKIGDKFDAPTVTGTKRLERIA